MDVQKATLYLFRENDDTRDMDKTDHMVWLGARGIPVSILTRFEDLWDITKRIGNTTIYIGKIIINKMIEFIQAHPHAVIGMALGAAIGALISLVPFIGPLLAPIATAIGACYGFCVGGKLDYSNIGRSSTVFESLVMLAKDFFKTLANILYELKSQLFD